MNIIVVHAIEYLQLQQIHHMQMRKIAPIAPMYVCTINIIIIVLLLFKKNYFKDHI